MQQFRDNVWALRWYFLPLSIFWLTAALFLGIKGYEESFLILNNALHYSATDLAGMYGTHLADGVILPLIILIWTWRKDRSLFVLAIMFILAIGGFSQMLKHTLFDTWDRPPGIFEAGSEFISLQPRPPKRHSFPSGHATTFAVGGLLFGWFYRERSKIMQVMAGILTILFCYTRVHIGVHFLGDILVGSIIGTIPTLIVLGFVYDPISKWMTSRIGQKMQRFEIPVLIIALALLAWRFIYLSRVYN